MHAIHCILCEVSGAGSDDPEDVLEHALAETERYRGKAFDKRAGGPVLLGKDDPGRFRGLLEKWKERPLRAALQFLKEIGGQIMVDEPLIHQAWAATYWEGQHVAWSLRQVFALANGDYVFESQFYSTPDHSPKIASETLRNATAHPEKYALVFLDYHY